MILEYTSQEKVIIIKCTQFQTRSHNLTLSDQNGENEYPNSD